MVFVAIIWHQILWSFKAELLKTQKLKMKKWLKNVKLRRRSVQVLMILLFKSCLLLGQNMDTKKVVVIDPGHGGKDCGAIGKNGVQEKEVVLNIAKAILELNKKSDSALDIYLTRYKDTLISLSNRTRLAKALKADIFLSLHCNHSDNPKARGIEVYVGKKESENSMESVWFAYQLQNQIKKQLGVESRGVKFASFQVLRETVDCCPSMLLELGFLSNWDELGYFQNIESIEVLAILILKYLKS